MRISILRMVFVTLLLGMLADPILSANASNLDKEVAHKQQIKTVSKVLDKLHASAAEADWETYFSLYREDATFLGTDASERWDMATFKRYASMAPNGWLYVMQERHIDFTSDGKTVWFDELLSNATYGVARGTGVLIRQQNGEWKVAQYHLTFPIPNALAREMTKKIQSLTAVAKD